MIKFLKFNMHSANKYRAMTLAEILITLGIIGIVAALTIPTLIQKQQEAATVSQLKKVYSTISNAFLRVTQENGTPDQWGLSSTTYDAASTNKIFDYFSPYLSISKNCGTGPGCFAKTYVQLNNTAPTFDMDTHTGLKKIVLSDGTSIAFANMGNISPEYYISIHVDINGAKQPNQYGKDVFSFYISKNKVIPRGSRTDTYSTFENYCNKAKTDSVYASGWSCTGWVIFNENMDYLHCNDLSWAGKQKCS